MSICISIETEQELRMGRYIHDKSLSLKAMGLMTLILSLPHGANFSIKGLMQFTKDGYESICGAFRELEKHGYIMRTTVRGDDGTYAGERTAIYENGGSTDGTL